ncbi:MAG: hypothetical protein ACI9FU_002478, partial [Granulosicoccus sp.]
MFRIRLAIFGLLVLAQSAASQVLHNPQQFYD